MQPIDLSLPDALSRRPGRPSAPLLATLNRALTDADMAALVLRPETTAPVQRLKKVTAVHHNMARLIANGVEVPTVGLICNRDPNYIRVLCNDPAFAELVAHYKSVVVEAFADVQMQLRDVTQDALAEIGRRMEESADEIPFAELMNLVRLGADRTGHGPTKTVRTVDAAGLLRELKAGFEAERQGRVLERETA